MPHDVNLILTLAGGLSAALVLGFITQKLRLSPLVGYLLAGIIVGPHSPGFVADASTAAQCAEIGVILLMFGVGLHFHLKDLLAVGAIATGGAAAQISLATLASMGLLHFFGFDLLSGAVYGMAISVASTVVLTRVLADNHDLHNPTGHVALGWLVVEDIFTILLLVLLPSVLSPGGEFWSALGMTLLKLAALSVFTLVVGQKLIPLFLGYVARTGTRDLFTLAVLALALGIAVAAAEFFGASMALGAFLAGMVVGQSEFSARAAAEALPLRDAFAVLFFVSVGMLFDPASLAQDWPLMLATLFVIMLVKPLGALLMTSLFRKPLKLGLPVAASLSQVGEFTFILAGLGISLGVFDQRVNNALIPAAIISITFNPMLYRKQRCRTIGLPGRAGRRQPRAGGCGGLRPRWAQLLPHFAGQQHAASGCGNEYRHGAAFAQRRGARGARRCHAGRSTARSWPGKGRSPAVDIPQYPRRRSDAHSARGESSCAHSGAHGLCERSPLPAR